MAEKRRDSKGRILRTGESQRKDGRYAYKYTDSTGKPQFVYAWKLVATDKTPAGKRDDISLREKEKEINRDIADGIDTVGKKMTVCQLYAKQNSQRADVKRGTKKQREYLMGLLRDDPLGGKSIDAVKPSDAKEWAIRMREKGFSFQSISNYKRSLRAAFFIAIEDDCIRKNPFSFALNKVLEDDRGEKTVLTPEQEVSLIDLGVIVQRHGDVGMAHDVLQRLGVHTGVCHTGTERVPERVGGDIGQLLLVMLVVLLHKARNHGVIVHAHFRRPVLFEKQEVCVAVHRNGGFLAPVLQHPPKRLIDRLTHRDFPIAAWATPISP